MLGGRYGDIQALGLSRTFHRIGFEVNRLTTATPPRIDGRSINYEGLQRQMSDNPPSPFSYLNEGRGVELQGRLIESFNTATTAQTHRVIKDNMKLLPTFLGNDGRGRGPRYCMSIEGKIRRFTDRDSHRIWLEPEGLETPIVYPNGLSTGFPPSGARCALARVSERAARADVGPLSRGARSAT